MNYLRDSKKMPIFAASNKKSTKMKETTYKDLIGRVNFTYLGSCTSSAKVLKTLKNSNILNYVVYLAPYNLSGKNVCPNGLHCHVLCLNGSGHNKADIISNKNRINKARIEKTRLFYKDRVTFMELLIKEITRYKRVASDNGLGFAVRLNGTSDLSPLAFHHPNVCGDKNILEIFPDVQFYDYTKVPGRINLNYPNYDITFSYDGYNWRTCHKYLRSGGRVAVVFENNLPKVFKTYRVIDGNESDARFNEGRCVVGLKFHKPAALYHNGRYIGIDERYRFVVRDGKTK
jgi:hypothetical protein